MQFNFVQSFNTKDVADERRVVGARAPSRPVQSELTNADYEQMSRAARRVSKHRSESFMDAFKKANPDWKPDFSKLG